MAKQPNTDPTLSGFLRESQRQAKRPARANVVLAPSVPAATPGAVVGKVEVFDAAGVSLGFLALYSTIT